MRQRHGQRSSAESDEYGFIAAADANAENVVHSLYDNIVDGRKVVVEFK